MKQKTVIIVGAGASAEFGLPVGSQLQNTISEKLDIKPQGMGVGRTGDIDIEEVCRVDRFDDFGDCLKAGCFISAGVKHTDSIDNFMDKHSGNEKIQYMGKLAIAKTICEAESRSTLFVDKTKVSTSIDSGKLDGTWLHQLFKNLQRGIHSSNVERIFDNISFVIFNYDRCVEHYLIDALVRVYDLNQNSAASIVGRANIYHPYGSLGDLPGLARDIGNSLEFGAVKCRLGHVAERISTYEEEVRDGSSLAEAREWVVNAQQMIFLGFAFHPQNVELLNPNDRIFSQRILGTSYAVSEFNRSEIELEMLRTFKLKSPNCSVKLPNMKCGKFMADFERAFY